MTEKTHNQEMRARIGKALLNETIEVRGLKVPLVGSTERIMIEFNGSDVAKIVPHFCIVK